MVLGRENDPLESVVETYFSNPATYKQSIGELMLGLVFIEKYYCIVLIRNFAIKMRNLVWVAMRC